MEYPGRFSVLWGSREGALGDGPGGSLGPYLECEVEATIEISGDVSVCTQCLQNGLKQQLPESLQHPRGTPWGDSLGRQAPPPAPLPSWYLLRFSFTSESFSKASFSSRYFRSGATACRRESSGLAQLDLSLPPAYGLPADPLHLPRHSE